MRYLPSGGGRGEAVKVRLSLIAIAAIAATGVAIIASLSLTQPAAPLLSVQQVNRILKLLAHPVCRRCDPRACYSAVLLGMAE
jgi:hypothetical protein